jgi:D-alanine-D-alanine ligase-like ATP-grasp enzyme
MEYKVISANRSPNRSNKNWRIFEKENLEKHFGPVLDVNGEDGVSVLKAFEKHKDTVEYIRWYPDPELLTEKEFKGMLYQNEKIGNIPYITNSAPGFKYVQSKEETFKKWKEAGVYCPDFFYFEDSSNFYVKQEENNIEYPFLIRLNNSVSGKHTYLIRKEDELKKALENLDKDFSSYTSTNSRIGTKRICVKLINSVDKERKVNSSFRIHVAGDKVISGYGRVVDQNDWLAITAGKFKKENIENFVYYNTFCENLMTRFSKEIVEAVHSLELNHQGVDAIYDFDNDKLCFLEVQPTYASGYPNGMGSYRPPFYNPYDKTLVNYLVENEAELIKLLPIYYNNWLDKNNHFNLVYKNLKASLDVRT